MKGIKSSEVDEGRCYILVEGIFSCAGEKENVINIGNKGWSGGIVCLDRTKRNIDSVVSIKNTNIRYADIGLYCGKGLKLDYANTLMALANIQNVQAHEIPLLG